MIGFEHRVSGSEIGRALVNDAEEMTYALIAMIEDAPEAIGADLAVYLAEGDIDAVCDFLRLLADKIEAAR